MKEHEDKPSQKISTYGIPEETFNNFPQMPNLTPASDLANNLPILPAILVLLSAGIMLLLFVSLMVKTRCLNRSAEGPSDGHQLDEHADGQDLREEPAQEELELGELGCGELEVDEVDHTYEEILETDL